MKLSTFKCTTHQNYTMHPSLLFQNIFHHPKQKCLYTNLPFFPTLVISLLICLDIYVEAHSISHVYIRTLHFVYPSVGRMVSPLAIVKNVIINIGMQISELRNVNYWVTWQFHGWLFRSCLIFPQKVYQPCSTNNVQGSNSPHSHPNEGGCLAQAENRQSKNNRRETLSIRNVSNNTQDIKTINMEFDSF